MENIQGWKHPGGCAFAEPDDVTLNHHCKRTNHITYCQLHFILLEHPSPVGHGWEIMMLNLCAQRHPRPNQLMAREDVASSGIYDDSQLEESTYLAC